MRSFLPTHARLAGLVLVLLAWPFAGSGALGQRLPTPNINFGVVAPADFKVTATGVDSTAEAVVLYDVGKVDFEYNGIGFWHVLTYHGRIKILKKSAYNRASIALNMRQYTASIREQLGQVEGYTYNLVNGAVVRDKLSDEDQFSEQLSPTMSVQKLTLPNVREGSIIEYRFKRKTPFQVSPNPATWLFQSDIPVLWSEYQIKVPIQGLSYRIMKSGYLPLDEQSEKTITINLGMDGVDGRGHRFVIKNAPAFSNEPYITTPADYLTKIDIELVAAQGMHYLLTWADIDKTLLDELHFGQQYNRTGFLRDEAALIRQQHPTDTLARLTAAYELVRNTMKWNEGNSLYCENVRKAWTDKKGDAGDINLLLVALLRELDFDANPVVLSTRSHGRLDEDHPLLKQLNYVVAHVALNGRDWLLDATDPLLKPGMLPERCLNGSGRLIHPTAGRFVSLTPTERRIDARIGTFTLSADGDVSGSMQTSLGGYAALDERHRYLSQGAVKYLESFKASRPAWQISQTRFDGIADAGQALTLSADLTIPDASMQTDNRLYLRPLLTEAITENLLKSPTRLYPIDFGMPSEQTFTATYALPDDYIIESLPAPVVVKLPNNGGQFTYQLVVNGRTLSVNSRVLLRQSVYPAGAYASLKEFYDTIVAKHAEPVVLKRDAVATKAKK
jgi:hypothetical protein